jgi:quinol monooxygenase YgiN
MYLHIVVGVSNNATSDAHLSSDHLKAAANRLGTILVHDRKINNTELLKNPATS